MRRIIVTESITLDGVIQAPGGADEDTRDDFAYGGWARPYMDEVMGREMGQGFGTTELLFGRRTYDQFSSYWPRQDDGNPFTRVLTDTTKYVVSGGEPVLPWANSTRVDGISGVAELKATPGKDLVVLGSGALVRSLLHADLVDEVVLLVHPVLLGTGRRIFEGGAAPVALRLADTVTTTTGVIIARYERSEDEPGGTR
jgi:dihydrofolate reductase